MEDDIPFLAKVRIRKDDQHYEGILLPSTTKEYFVLKLENGYNIGIDRKDASLEVLDQSYEQKQQKESFTTTQKPIMILHTGGTIASKIDYATGAVLAGYTPEEILRRYPELDVGAAFVANIQSEMMRFGHYNLMAEAIQEQIQKGTKAIILTHGTDTLHYTAAALGFMLQNLPIPVILVGSQRSSDRPSTDAQINLFGAVKFAQEAIKQGITGVFIAMHHTTSDDTLVIIDGFHARKMHTSRRDTFKAINVPPFALVQDQKITFLQEPKQLPQQPFMVRPFKPDLKVALVKTHPHMQKEQLLGLKGFDGIVLEGTGLGHAPIDAVDEYSQENKALYEALQTLLAEGTVIAIAPQTLYGRINLQVYSPQRRLRTLGIIGHLCDMTPETAFIKLAWLLSNYPKEHIAQLYETNLCGEMTERSLPEGYYEW